MTSCEWSPPTRCTHRARVGGAVSSASSITYRRIPVCSSVDLGRIAAGASGFGSLQKQRGKVNGFTYSFNGAGSVRAGFHVGLSAHGDGAGRGRDTGCGPRAVPHGPGTRADTRACARPGGGTAAEPRAQRLLRRAARAHQLVGRRLAVRQPPDRAGRGAEVRAGRDHQAPAGLRHQDRAAARLDGRHRPLRIRRHHQDGEHAGLGGEQAAAGAAADPEGPERCGGRAEGASSTGVDPSASRRSRPS